MSKQYPGGLITKSPVTPSGPYSTDSASGIWTLDQQAYWQKLGQWPNANNPPLDPQFNYVTMLLHGDGTNGAQNNTFLDSSTNNFTITRNGNTTQGSFSPYGSNWSNFFAYNATAVNYLVSSSVSLSGTFTIEGYVYWDGVGSNPNMFTLGDSSLSTGLEIYLSGGNWVMWSNGAQRIAGSAGVVGQWTYIALTRTGTTVTMYINGVSQGTWTSSATFSGTVKIGAEFYASVYYTSMSGYISNFRINNTTAINTVPTVPLTAVSGTVLLTCQSNRFVDNSASPLTITVNGTPSVQRFNPFGTATAYSTATIGGSGYFDGTGDYLAVAANSANLGTGDFSITFWMYCTADPVNSVVATNVYNQNAFTDGWYIQCGDKTVISFGIGSAGGADGVSSPSGIDLTNQWNYIEATRSGSTVRVFVNGVSGTTKTITKTGTKSGNDTKIGSRYDGSAVYLPGYITDFKVVIGTAGNTSNYTPPTAPASATGSTLMLSMQNGAIFDNAMMNDLETVGNAQISTSVKKYGTGSLAFDGTTDYLQAPTNQIYAFGTGNFTIEFWVYANSWTATASTVVRIAGASDWVCQFDGSGVMNFYANGSAQLVDSGSPSTGVWTHYAIVRSGTSLKMYRSGTSVASATYATSIGASNVLLVGCGGDSNNTLYCLNGYIDDLRITKGYARYTANFTPPTQAFFNTGPV